MEQDAIVVKNYRLVKKIGKGAFGEIWKAVHNITKEEVAIKFEDAKSKLQQLYSECKVYMWLHEDPTIIEQAIPQVLYYGLESDKNIMIMDLLGESLESLFCFCERIFTLKTVLLIADQTLKRIEFIHSRRILHRDIKPDNFAMGRGKNSHRIFIIDFGLAKKFKNSQGQHIKYRDGKSLTGTARYASLATHMGIEQSRRDDLESLGYIFVYFMKGILPWQNLSAKNMKEKYEKIKNKKAETKLEDLCKGLPVEFTQYLSYCRGIKFETEPDYAFLRSLFKNLLKGCGFEEDNIFDWTGLNPEN